VELHGVRPCNLEQSTSFTTSPRTVAEHLQAPAEDSFSSTREPSSGAVVTEQRVRCRIQISGLNSTQLNNGQQVLPAYTVNCYCLHLTPANSSSLRSLQNIDHGVFFGLEVFEYYGNMNTTNHNEWVNSGYS